MGPKVAAAMHFVDQGGQRAVITSLEHIETAITGDFGTVIQGRSDPSQSPTDAVPGSVHTKTNLSQNNSLQNNER
jgi:carbamate kinase